MLAESPDGPPTANLATHSSILRRQQEMLGTDTQESASFSPRPAVSEVFARTVDAPLPAVQAAAAQIDVIESLVDGLIAVGVDDHLVAPCSNGFVWRFDRSGYRRVRVSWSLQVEPETDDATLVSLAVRFSGSDDAASDRLLEAWPVLGPVVELHARRVLHAVEALAEEGEEDPYRSALPELTAVSTTR
jgi:hypothetical protein